MRRRGGRWWSGTGEGGHGQGTHRDTRKQTHAQQLDGDRHRNKETHGRKWGATGTDRQTDRATERGKIVAVITFTVTATTANDGPSRFLPSATSLRTVPAPTSLIQALELALELPCWSTLQFFRCKTYVSGSVKIAIPV